MIANAPELPPSGFGGSNGFENFLHVRGGLLADLRGEFVQHLGLVTKKSDALGERFGRKPVE